MSLFYSKFINKILEFPRLFKQLIAVCFDATSCIVSVWISYYLRLGEFVFISKPIEWPIIISVVLAIPIFVVTGLYREIFRYSGLHTIIALSRAILIYGILFSIFFTVYGIDGVPRTIGLIQPILLLFIVGGSRLITNILFDGIYLNKIKKTTLPQALIYGAGSAGRQLAAALNNSKEMHLVGFLDDDIKLHGNIINGLVIYNPNKLPKIIVKKNVTDILLALPSASRKRHKEIAYELSPHMLTVKTLPGMSDILAGKINLSDLRSLDIDELLGRDPVKPDIFLLNRNTHNKTVMITGAGGSIGSELCRQIFKTQPCRILLVEMSEFALYQVHQELVEMLENRNLFGFQEDINIEILPLLGSVCDSKRISEIMGTWRPNTVYHAAAFKHVPIVEHNIVQGIYNNVFGTLVCANTAVNFGVEDFVLISTDKAVRPTNIMGASKRLAEMILQALNDFHSLGNIQNSNLQELTTRFSMVRFGNVLGSSGSVVPLFRDQIKKGGPITLTHMDITRYFMTIPEAAQLVIQAGAMGIGGDVFVLNMGSPVPIYELAERIIELSGFRLKNQSNPNGDIEIMITGLRPGEKLYEELLIGKNSETTQHSEIMRAHEEFLSWPQLKQNLDFLLEALNKNDLTTVQKILKELVSGYEPNAKIVDWVYNARSSDC
jgi:FlaA1/EpsC-like NDP-sugar epimerase